MLRQIMVPTEENSTISIPVEFYGKEIEVLVFPYYRSKSIQTGSSMRDLFSKHLFSFDDYKFDRDEANDYEMEL